jgi:hypothetical protein
MWILIHRERVEAVANIPSIAISSLPLQKELHADWNPRRRSKMFREASDIGHEY